MLISIIFIIKIGTGTYFVYYKYMNHVKTAAKESFNYQTTFNY